MLALRKLSLFLEFNC